MVVEGRGGGGRALGGGGGRARMIPEKPVGATRLNIIQHPGINKGDY